jgi:hypothetical protein
MIKHRTLHHAGSTGAATSSTAIKDWIALPRDVAYTVPNGTYTPDQISATYGTTGGTYNGWIILVAQTQGSVIVDMSPPAGWTSANTNTYDLDFTGVAARVLFVGFKFINGKVYVGSDRLRFWYCEFTFPASVWNAENGHGNTSGGFYHGYHQECRTLQMKSGNNHVETYGCDFHGTGTAIYFEGGGSPNFTTTGAKLYDLTDGGGSVDPLDNVHPDGMALFGQHSNTNITDTYIHPDNDGTAGIGTENSRANASVINLTDVWITGAGNAGMVTGDGGIGDSLSGTLTRVHIWNNGTGAHDGRPAGADTNDSTWQFVEYDGGSDNGLYNINSHHHFGTTSNCNTTVAQVGTDPATAWRAVSGHAIGDWAAFFSGNWP